ncbi:10355_t:CDS:2, partial [Ambispora gerdemannii]
MILLKQVNSADIFTVEQDCLLLLRILHMPSTNVGKLFAWNNDPLEDTCMRAWRARELETKLKRCMP